VFKAELKTLILNHFAEAREKRAFHLNNMDIVYDILSNFLLLLLLMLRRLINIIIMTLKFSLKTPYFHYYSVLVLKYTLIYVFLFK